MQGSTKTVGGGSATPTADAYNKFLQSQMKGGSGANTAISTMLGGGPSIDTSKGMANLPNSPSYAATTFNPMNNNLDLSQFNGSNIMGSIPTFGQASNMAGNATSMLNNGNFSASTGPASMDFMNTQPSQFGVSNVNMPNADVNSARANAIKSVLDRQNALNLANTHARYAAGGMGSLGSGASLADAQSNAEGQNQLLAGLQGITQQDIGNTLNFGQLNSSNMLQSQGMQSNDILSRLGLQNQNMLGNRQISSNEAISSAGNALQAAMSSGQINSSMLGNLLNYGTNLGQLGLGVNQLGATNMLNQGNFNNNATQTNNQNMFNENQGMNTFNTNMFGQNSSNALQNQNLGNQFGLGAAGQQSQNMQAILSQIFGGLNGSNQIGNPQAQTVQTPSPFSQITNGISQLGPLIAAPFTGGASLAAYGMPGMGGGGGASGLSSIGMGMNTPSSIGGIQPTLPGIQPMNNMGGYVMPNTQGFNPSMISGGASGGYPMMANSMFGG